MSEQKIEPWSKWAAQLGTQNWGNMGAQALDLAAAALAQQAQQQARQQLHISHFYPARDAMEEEQRARMEQRFTEQADYWLYAINSFINPPIKEAIDPDLIMDGGL